MDIHNEAELLSEFRRFMSLEWHEDETVRMLRFHLHLCQRSDHLTTLKQQLKLRNPCSSSEFLIYADYLAYLVNFEEYDLEEEVNIYLNIILGGIFSSEEAKKCYVMLAQPQQLNGLVIIVKNEIEDITQVSTIKELLTKMKLFSLKIKWELKKASIAQCKPAQDMQELLNTLMMELLKVKRYGNREQVLMEIAKLTACVFEYLKTDAASHKITLHPLMNSWLTLKIHREDVKKEVMKTLKISIRAFGLYDMELFFKFFSLNVHMVGQIEYNELLSAFLEKLTKIQKANQSQINKIVRQLFSAIIRAPSRSAVASYRSKSLMFDQIIKIFNIHTIDLSKNLSQSFRDAQNTSHEAFMWALMLIFDHHRSAETIDSIEAHKLRYLGRTRQGEFYSQILQHYSKDTLDLEGLIINPQEKDDFMWEILLLRTTVIINYNALCEIGKVNNLVINLIKIMLLDFFPEECLEIIEKILEREHVYTMEELADISFSHIIESVRPILLKLVQNQISNDSERLSQCFRNFGRVIRLITSRYEVSELSGTNLFLSVISLSNILPYRFATHAFMKYQAQLLELAMPIDLTEVKVEEFSLCMNGLFSQIQRFRGITAFLLYLEMMNRAILHTQLVYVFSSLHAKMKTLIQRQPLNIVNSYNIAYYITSGGQINKEVLDQSWTILSDFGSFQYSQLFFISVSLQKYAARWVFENCGDADREQFLLYQLIRGEEILQQLDKKERETVILLRLEQLFAFKQTLLMYLQEIFMFYSEINTYSRDEPLTINGYLFRAYQGMKSTQPPAQTFEKSPAIQQYWCNCQILVLIMVTSMLRRQKTQNAGQIMDMYRDIVSKFQILKKLYPKGHEKQFQKCTFCLSSELLQLKIVAKNKFSQLTL